MLLSIQLNLFEFVILFVSAGILGGAIKFFVASNRALKQTIKEDPSLLSDAHAKKHGPLQLEMEEEFEAEYLTSKKEQALLNDKEVKVLKEQIQQQQKSLSSLVNKLDELDLASINNNLKDENEELKEQIEKLEIELEQKESDIHHYKQKDVVAQKMATRLEEVYKEFDYLQKKIAELESQSGNVTNVELSLREASESLEGTRRELQRKQDRLDEVLHENQQLHHRLSEAEDKLAESNMQRQQLLKKVQYLSEQHTEMQNITDTNKKLQNELRRISELEGMLNMMIEERDQSNRSKGV